MKKHVIEDKIQFFCFNRLKVQIMDIDRENPEYYIQSIRNELNSRFAIWRDLALGVDEYLVYISNKDKLPIHEPIASITNRKEQKIIDYKKMKVKNSVEEAFGYHVFLTCSVFFNHLWMLNSYLYGFQPLLFSKEYLSLLQALKTVQINDFIEEPMECLEKYPFVWELTGEKDPCEVQILFMSKEQIDKLYKELVYSNLILDEGLKIDHKYFLKLLKEARKEENDLVLFYYDNSTQLGVD